MSIATTTIQLTASNGTIINVAIPSPKPFAGYSHEQLEEAFDRVRNLQDWKAPVDTVCLNLNAASIKLIKTAVLYFTGTEATIVKLGKKQPGVYQSWRVTADGYRMGPCA